MKKKLLVLILTMTMGLSIIACGKSGNSENNDNSVSNDISINTEDVSSEAPEEDLSEGETGARDNIIPDDTQLETTVENENEGISFSLLDDGKTVLEKLGEPASETEGEDYYYNTYYNAAEVTYDKDGDNVEIIEFKSFSNAWKTSKGITIGSTLDEIKTAYGDPSAETNEDEHCVSYFYDGGYSISFTLNSADEVTMFMFSLGRG